MTVVDARNFEAFKILEKVDERYMKISQFMLRIHQITNLVPTGFIKLKFKPMHSTTCVEKQ